MFWAKWLVIIASYKKMYFLKKNIYICIKLHVVYEKRHVVNYWILALYLAWLVTREMQVVVVIVIVEIVVLIVIVVIVEVLGHSAQIGTVVFFG